jgi:hypothetical protein
LEEKIRNLQTALQVAEFLNPHLLMDLYSADIDQFRDREDLPMGLVLQTRGPISPPERGEFFTPPDCREFIKTASDAISNPPEAYLYRLLLEINRTIDRIIDSDTRNQFGDELRGYKLRLMGDVIGCYFSEENRLDADIPFFSKRKVLSYPGLAEKTTPESAITKQVLNELYKGRRDFVPYTVHMKNEQINEELREICKQQRGTQ